jgi:hypothetical protein
MHSQTPYGPHVPMGAMSAAGLPPPAMMGPMGAMQEDISTIFVVGFPEDMQVSQMHTSTYARIDAHPPPSLDDPSFSFSTPGMRNQTRIHPYMRLQWL